MDAKELEKKVFNAINTELKSFIVYALLDNEAYMTTYDLASKARTYVESSVLPKNPEVYKQHCKHSLDKATLKYFTQESGNAWRLNELGTEVLKPIAGFCLNRADEFDMSFYQLLGLSLKDGPYNSFAVFREIFNNKQIQVKNLESSPNINKTRNFSDNLKRLSNLDLIEYRYINNKKGENVSYVWNNKKDLSRVKKTNNYPNPTLTMKIAKIMYEYDGNLSSKNVSDLLGYSSLSAVEKSLRALEKRNFIKSTSFVVGNEKRSEIKITNKGTKFYRMVILPISKHLDPNNIKGQNYVRNRRAKSSQFQNVLSLYSDASKRVFNFDQRKAQVTSIVTKKMSYGEIEKAAGVKVTKHLNSLIKDKKIEKVGRGLYAPTRS